jgi:hypothetical protein
MIRIGRLSLTLPPEFAARGEEVARHVGDALAAMPVTQDRYIAQLGGLQLHLPRGASIAEAGHAIARSIAARAGLGKEGGGHG